jgi:hypothetical protein
MAAAQLTFEQPSSHTAVSKTFFLDEDSSIVGSDTALLAKW